MNNQEHIKEMVAMFKDDFNMVTEEEVHLLQEEHDKALYEYVIKRICDNWEIDLNYSKVLEQENELLRTKLKENE